MIALEFLLSQDLQDKRLACKTPSRCSLSRSMVRRPRRSSARLRRLPTEICLRGRVFRRTELERIRTIIKRHGPCGRTFLSEQICKEFDWRQPNGWLKDRACRDVLRALHAARFIRLPEPLIRREYPPYAKWKPLSHESTSDHSEITDLPGPLILCLAKGNANEKLWNALVQRHHYLGHKVTVGRCMKFLIYSATTLVGAISLADSAWNVQDRDAILRRFDWTRQTVANNSRFLILPHIRIKHLASRCLALLAREGVRHWNLYYASELQCLETFVDTTRFTGTSYKAANWIFVGRTKGFRKCGSAFYNSQTPKFVFLYPLRPSDRSKLTRLQNGHKP